MCTFISTFISSYLFLKLSNSILFGEIRLLASGIECEYHVLFVNGNYNCAPSHAVSAASSRARRAERSRAVSSACFKVRSASGTGCCKKKASTAASASTESTPATRLSIIRACKNEVERVIPSILAQLVVENCHVVSRPTEISYKNDPIIIKKMALTNHVMFARTLVGTN